MTVRPSGLLAALAFLSLLACGSTPTTELARVDVPATTVFVDEAGPWEEVHVPPASTPAARAPVPDPQPPVPAPRPRVAPPPVAAVPVPRRRATPPPAPAGARPTKSLALRARERHLDHPTLVRAASITFYCPRPYLPEVRLTGDEVAETRPGRKVATGGARLTCRELTLEADRVVLRVREAACPDVQVTARGNVSFVTDQRGRVLREEGVRMLILTNDEVTPLR